MRLSVVLEGRYIYRLLLITFLIEDFSYPNLKAYNNFRWFRFKEEVGEAKHGANFELVVDSDKLSLHTTCRHKYVLK